MHRPKIVTNFLFCFGPDDLIKSVLNNWVSCNRNKFLCMFTS